MTDYILSLDPGLSTGVALVGYEEDSAPWLEKAWQFSGGLQGVKEFFGSSVLPLRLTGTPFYAPSGGLRWGRPGGIVIAEKFTARNTKGFAYTTSSLEPLRVEGALVWEGLMPDYAPSEKRWRDPGLQYLVGGKDLADKKKSRDRFLKESGFYRTPKELDASDANDFRSACSHALNYLAREVRHKPTWKLITDWTEANG